MSDVKPRSKHHGRTKQRDEVRDFFEKSIFVVAVLVPISNLPQLYQVWFGGDVSGVSVPSWALFAVFSFFWMMYGIYHKDKPIIFQSFALILIQSAIVLGVVVNS